MNRVQIIGNIGAEPEMRYTQSGIAVTTIRVAVNRNYKGKDGQWEKKTSWFSVTAWDKKAELINNLKKGDTIYVEGSLEQEKYTAKDGSEKEKVSIRLDDCYKVERIRSFGETTESQPTASSPLIKPPSPDDDIPF